MANRKVLTFTVSAASEEKLEELHGILSGHTEQFSDENDDEEIEWDNAPVITDAQ